MLNNGIVEETNLLLTTDERLLLLHLAREALELGVIGKPLTKLDLRKLPVRLRQTGASFVTLTIGGVLRGCIGSLEASLPLAEDVRLHAIAAAIQDYRFPPVRSEELPGISIEISRLTPLQPLEYSSANELLVKLRPGIDGVVVMDGSKRGTFLPQVWEKAPEPDIFLTMLCRKIGISGDSWRNHTLSVFVYEVEEFHEESGSVPAQ
jgi:AmmeMemoRadiSam system protein A